MPFFLNLFTSKEDYYQTLGDLLFYLSQLLKGEEVVVLYKGKELQLTIENGLAGLGEMLLD